VRPVKPDRDKSKKRIDGMAALLLALEGSLVASDEAEPFAVWT
jgi:hypothetical protein